MAGAPQGGRARCRTCRVHDGSPETPVLVRFFKSAEAVAPSLKVKLVPLDVRDTDEIERSLAAFAAEGNGGLIVSPNAVTFSNRDLSGLSMPRQFQSGFSPNSAR